MDLITSQRRKDFPTFHRNVSNAPHASNARRQAPYIPRALHAEVGSLGSLLSGGTFYRRVSLPCLIRVNRGIDHGRPRCDAGASRSTASRGMVTP